MKKSAYVHHKEDGVTSRFRFLTELNMVCLQVVPTKRVFLSGASFGFKCQITPAGLPPQWIQIDFTSWNLNSPQVTTTAFPGSPHRYSDGRLCLWYPQDPVELRWTWQNGGEELIAHVCAHLIREYWWKQTGEWPGPEAPHSKELQSLPDTMPKSMNESPEMITDQELIGARL